jgi:hypothetical protein
MIAFDTQDNLWVSFYIYEKAFDIYIGSFIEKKGENCYHINR